MTRELTNYEQFQLDRWGDILPTPYIYESEEPGEREAERFAQWAHDQHERQLHESEI